MALPLVDVSENFLRAFLQGTAERREREQFEATRQLQLQQNKLAEERERRLEKQVKEQQRLSEIANNELAKFRKAQIEVDKQRNKLLMFGSLVNSGVKFKPQNFPQVAESMIPGYTDEIVAPQFAPQQVFGEEFSPLEQQLVNESIGRNEALLKRTELAANSREEIARMRQESANEANLLRKEIEQMKMQSALERAMLKNIPAGPDPSVDAIVNQVIEGTIAVDKLPSSLKSSVISQIAQRGEFAQTEKWQAEAKKLRDSKSYLMLMEKFAGSNPFRSMENLGKFLAYSGITEQRIGQLGAQFPALGRLTDNDIKLLQKGNLTPNSVATAKLLEKFGLKPDANGAKVFIDTVMNEARRAYAFQLKTTFATVPRNAEIRNRLTKQYDLGFPGLGKYLKEN